VLYKGKFLVILMNTETWDAAIKRYGSEELLIKANDKIVIQEIIARTDKMPNEYVSDTRESKQGYKLRAVAECRPPKFYHTKI